MYLCFLTCIVACSNTAIPLYHPTTHINVVYVVNDGKRFRRRFYTSSFYPPTLHSTLQPPCPCQGCYVPCAPR
mgnify:CR=1 FL=1